MADPKLHGTPFVRYPNPVGSGGPVDLLVDGDKPPVDTVDSMRQYDSYMGGPAFIPGDFDFIGLVFDRMYSIRRVVFVEGMEFVDGGWFETLELQIRVKTVWKPVSTHTVTPVYPGAPDGHSFNTYTFDFPPHQGDGVRLYGKPGGLSAFVSCGEIEAFGVPYEVPLSPGVTFQEPPYSGPYNPLYYKNPPFATQDNPRDDEVRWCRVCNRPVVVDDRQGFRHRHFSVADGVEVGE